MKKIALDQEEKDMLNAYESGEFESVMTEERKKSIQAIAANTFKKDKRINIRLSGLQKRALEESIPYQTLVSSILHKYVSGSLYDVTANKPNRK